MQDRGMAGSDEARSALALEQAQVLCSNQLTSLPMSCVLAVSVSVSVREDVSGIMLWSWLAAVMSTNIARFAYAAWQHKSGSHTRDSIKILVWGALLSGLIWSFVPGAMIDLGSSHAPMIIFTLCGLTAGATVQSSPVAYNALAFVFPIMGTIAVKCLLADSEGASFLAVSTVLYLWLVFNASRRGESTFANTVMLTWEAQASAQNLHRLANHDPLTGLANRTAFATHLDAALWGAVTARSGCSCSTSITSSR